MINRKKHFALVSLAALIAANILFATANAQSTTLQTLTLDPALLKTDPALTKTTALTPSVNDKTLGVDSTTLVPSSDLLNPGIITGTGAGTSTCDPKTDPNCTTTTTDTGTVGTSTTTACDPKTDRNCATTTDTGGTTCDPGTDPNCTTNTTTTGGTNSATSTATTADTSGSRDGAAAGTDLSGMVDMETINIGPLGTENTQVGSQECPATATGRGDCITPGQAVDYAAPQIVGQQAKIAAIILLSTVIGLVITILISYLLNNYRGKRDLERIRSEGEKYTRKFASNEVYKEQTQIIDALASIISKSQSGKAFTKQESSLIQKELSRLGLFGSPETSAVANRLITLLNGAGATTTGATTTGAATAGTKTSSGATTPGVETGSEIAKTAEELSGLLKKDLGL